MPRLIQKGSTDITLYFFIADSADGSPETGITITDLDLQYVRFGVAPSAKVDATALAATDSAHGDNQAIEIDATDQPGLYRVDWPDAAFATGVDGVILTVKGTGFHPSHMEIQLVDFDPTDAVRLGLTALPNANADAAGGVPISDAGGLDMDAHVLSARNAGYAGGAVWVDTGAANTNTVSYVDGVADNPVSTMAAAKVIADALGLKIFRLVPDSSVTLGATYDGYVFDGYGAVVDLNGQSIDGSVFLYVKINGNDDGSNAARVRYIGCDIDGSTLGQFIACSCRMTGTITLAEIGTYFLDDCYSGVAGLGTPNIDFGAALGVTNLNLRHHSGGIHIENMGNTGADQMSLEGKGQLIINANCDPSGSPVIAIRGHFTVTDNVVGGFADGGGTISEDARYDVAQIQAQVTAALIAANLDHMMLTPVANNADMTVEVPDGTVLSNIMTKGSDTSDFVVGTDSLEAIRDAIVDANPQNHAATANNETTGTLDSGTFADTATDNEVYYQTSPVTPAVGGFGLNVDLTFGIGTGRVASSVIVNGRFTAGAQRTVQVWAYDYNIAAYVQLSNSSTDFGNSGSDSTQQYAMTVNMRQASDGEVKIRFTSTSTTVGDDWYCDYVSVSSVAQEAAGLTTEAIAQGVWEHLTAGHAVGTMGHVLDMTVVVHANVVSATDGSQFIIDTGIANDDAFIGSLIMMDDATDGHTETRRIIDYIGATKEVFVNRAFSFTPVADDECHIIGPSYADVNVTHSGGTSQTGNDNGADVNGIKAVTDLLPDAGALNDLAAILVDTALTDKWTKNKIAFSGANMILYDDDGTTPLLTWVLSQGSTTVSGPYDRAKAT